jgi:TfoX/Sxy family transcriptional regulator of competence genes
MAYDQNLAMRVRSVLRNQDGLVEKKMFGGIGYLVNGNMACGVHGNNLIVRVGRERYQDALSQPGTRVFDLNGKPMAGWIYVEPKACETEEDLQQWIEYGIEYALSLQPK